ncbi:hypothetical protein THASP1DRAFT_30703 [Thamnocephalis sphaerospora]|uniref:Lanthionine synthetase C-like protein n=1 Tax=Thamnocephalis sphaerospora TaxID=78915 RepID=A0A4P9XNG8_9FUNG|nr:hypothetical protein THASP1DRAFT_30703 [Thamnocephalis sphaerospora]|eukprot:RKP07486.1 hypothetical protein THASP1DRAFT_30703 [Thamnocephalis sphaerospora]
MADSIPEDPPIPQHIQKDREGFYKLCERLLHEVPPSSTQDQTGLAGYALLFLRIHEWDVGDAFSTSLTAWDSAIALAGEYIDAAVAVTDAHRQRQHAHGHIRSAESQCGFLCTDVGMHAVAFAIYRQLDRERDAADHLRKVLDAATISEQASMSSELLYGRAGYLYALQFVRTHLADADEERRAEIDRIAARTYALIIEDGQRTSRQWGLDHRTPLLWQWHGKAYLGAAHGTAGILTILMRWPELAKRYAPMLQVATDFVLFAIETWTFSVAGASEGVRNWPSSIRPVVSEQGDSPLERAYGRTNLFQFCHGAPGIGLCALQAHATFGNRRYFDVAVRAADATWVAGIGQKGVGLCHGVAGNAYLQLLLLRHTEMTVYADRVRALTLVCRLWESYTRNGTFRLPDHPWSLWEGLAGAVWLLADHLSYEVCVAMRDSDDAAASNSDTFGPRGFPCLSDI